MNKDKIFDRLWNDYTSQNPQAKAIYDLFVSHDEEVVNDHIAFRTFNHPYINISVLSQVFLKVGYKPFGDYHFEDKKLNAVHFEHQTDKLAPRVFISELLLEEFSSDLQSSINQIVEQIPADILKSDELVFSGRVWNQPSFETYKKLKSESEYAAWLYVFGFQANHFTVSINYLKKLTTIQAVNQFLKDNGFKLNDSGGEIKGTPEELLEQSSTKAGAVAIDFVEGTYEIPSCYYEFAKRYPDATGNLYSGFIAKSADKIFESTDFQDLK